LILSHWHHSEARLTDQCKLRQEWVCLNRI
jgi:hypothetical protein